MMIYLPLSNKFLFKKNLIKNNYLKEKIKELLSNEKFKIYDINYYNYDNYKISIKNIRNFIIILTADLNFKERHFIKAYEKMQFLFELKNNSYKYLEKKYFLDLYNDDLISILNYFNNIKQNDQLEIALEKSNNLVKKAKNQKEILLENSNKIELLNDHGINLKDQAKLFQKNAKKLENTIYFTKKKMIAGASLLTWGIFLIFYIL